MAEPMFWLALICQLIVVVGYFWFYRKEQLCAYPHPSPMFTHLTMIVSLSSPTVVYFTLSFSVLGIRVLHIFVMDLLILEEDLDSRICFVNSDTPLSLQ